MKPTGTINVGNSTSVGDMDVQGALMMEGGVLNIRGASQNDAEVNGPTTIGQSSGAPATVNVETGVFVTNGPASIRPTGTINVSANYYADEDLTIDGGKLLVGAGGDFSFFQDGITTTTMTIQNGGQATFAGDHFTGYLSTYNIVGAGSKMETTSGSPRIIGGSDVNVTAGGLLSSASSIDIGNFSQGGRLTVDGPGSRAVAAVGSISNWGDADGPSGGVAHVTFSHLARGDFGDLRLAPGVGPGTQAFVNIYSGADVTAGNLKLAANGGLGVVAIVDIQDGGSSLTLNGDSTLTVGNSNSGAAIINVGTAFGSSQSDNRLTTGAGLTTINKTGAILVGTRNSSIGALTVKGDLLIDGGLLLHESQSSFIWVAGKTMTVRNGGVADFRAYFYSTAPDATYLVTGADSQFNAYEFFVGYGARLDIVEGGVVSTAVFDGNDNIGHYVNADGTLGGNGLVDGNLQNGGLVEPGASLGTLTIDGSYSQTSSGVLHMEIADATSFDRLAVTGAAALGGTFDVDFVNGFVPSPGASFDLLDWASPSGTFAMVSLPPLPSVLAWNTSQLYTTGVLSVTGTLQAADFDENGAVNNADLARWKTNFGLAAGATHVQGDAHGDADVDGGDFLVWQRQRSGVGAVESSTAVPEPGGGAMLVVLSLIGVFARRSGGCAGLSQGARRERARLKGDERVASERG